MAVTVRVLILAAEPSAATWADALTTSDDLVVSPHTSDADVLCARAADEVPDVVVVDAAMPALDVVGLCGRLADDVPVARVLLVGTDESLPVAAMAAGAAGAIAADAPDAEVVRRLARGEGVLTQRWASALVDDDAAPRFTATEREVLQRLAKGATIDSVAAMHEVPSHVVGLHAGYALAKVHRAAHDDRAERDAAGD